jgi:hypothetical protein
MNVGLIVSKLFGNNAATVQTVAAAFVVVALNVVTIVMFDAVSGDPQSAEGTDTIAAISEESIPQQQVTVEPEQAEAVIMVDGSGGVGIGEEKISDGSSDGGDGGVQDSGQDQQGDFERGEESSGSDTEPVEITDQGSVTSEVRVPERLLDRSPYQPP